MATDRRYLTTTTLEPLFVDKDTGERLAGGTIEFYKDSDRNIFKPVYELAGAPPNYTFEQLPNPIQLSAIGTIQDNIGNNVALYYFPFEEPGDVGAPVELYYIVVKNAAGIEQFTREGFPDPSTNNFDPVDPDNPFVPGEPGSPFIPIPQPANAFAVGDVVYNNGTVFVKAIADATAPAEVVGIVSAILDVDNFVLQISGLVTGILGPLIPGSYYYLSDTVEGTVNIDPPVLPGHIRKPVYIALTATTAAWYNPRGSEI